MLQDRTQAHTQVGSSEVKFTENIVKSLFVVIIIDAFKGVSLVTVW